MAYDYANGYWSAKAAPWLNALQTSPGRRGAAEANRLRSNSTSLLSRLRRYTNAEFAITTNDGNDFETEESAILLEGTAPVQVARMLLSVNGSEPALLDVTWSGGSTPTRWSASVQPVSKENQIQLFGLDSIDELIEEASIKVTLPSAPEDTFVRGDAQGDLRVNISDAVAVLGHLFNGRPVRCVDAADVDDNGTIEITDALYIVEYLFLEGARPPAPFPDPGVDPTEDALDCRE